MQQHAIPGISARRGRAACAGGFTLIEVLLAVAITSVVMLTIATTFRVTLEAREVVEELSESTEAGPRILQMIERDLRGLWTFNVKKNAILRGRSSDVGSFEADRLDLLTTTDAVGYVLDGHNEQRRPTICEVGYWLKANPRYRDLIELWRREDPMVDDDLLTDGRFQLVHDRLKSFKITYYKTLGNEAEEFHDWDSSIADELPRRIKIEFTLERKRGSRNIVNDAELEDFEGAEKTYVRHIVLDQRLQEILQVGAAMIPLPPPPPEEEAAGGGGSAVTGGPGGAAGSGGVAGITGEVGVGDGSKGRATTSGKQGATTSQTTGSGRGTRGGGQGQGMPPGFNLGELMRGGGGQGLGGLFPGGGGGRR
jgi:general secretion pathway protein J